MKNDICPDSAATKELLDRFEDGDTEALEHLLDRHRRMLVKFVEFRLDQKVRARLDPSDVVQEAHMEVVKNMDDFLRDRPMPFHLWVRKMAYWRLINQCRNHRKAARRSVDREQLFPERSSVLLAQPLLSGPTPIEELQAKERAERIGQAVAKLSDQHREILLMRNAEQLGYDEISLLLDIPSATARRRYGRALLRLRKVLSESGLLEFSHESHEH